MKLLLNIDHSAIPFSPTLIFSNLPVTRNKSRFPSPVKRCNFNPDFSESPIFRDSTAVILECNKTGRKARRKLYARAVVRSANVPEASYEDTVVDRQAIISTTQEYMTCEKATK